MLQRDRLSAGTKCRERGLFEVYTVYNKMQRNKGNVGKRKEKKRRSCLRLPKRNSGKRDDIKIERGFQDVVI